MPPTMWSKLSLKCCYHNQADRVISKCSSLIVSFLPDSVQCFLPGIYMMYALLGKKRMPLPACVYHEVRKTFIPFLAHKEELKKFERCQHL